MGGGGWYQKMTKNCLQEEKAERKLFANSLSEKNCLHGNFEDFENFKISSCSKDAFLLELTRQHSITFWYTF